jgi:hypothetical protein
MIFFIYFTLREHTFVAQGLSIFTSQMWVIFVLPPIMPNPSLKLKQPHKPKKAVSEQHCQQKRSLALQQYAERRKTP